MGAGPRSQVPTKKAPPRSKTKTAPSKRFSPDGRVGCSSVQPLTQSFPSNGRNASFGCPQSGQTK